jgi:hypothetical protein
MVAATASRMADETLRQQVTQADLIVVGRVSSTREAPERAPTLSARAGGRWPVSEHDPMLAEATVEVREVIKGNPDQQSIVVPYPTSQDVMWYDTPKFHVNQEGIFLLHTGQAVAGLALDEPIALNPMDIQPLDQLEHIRSIISNA